MSSGSRAFKFFVAENAQLAGYNLAFGDRHSPLNELLERSDTLAFLVVRDDAVLFERYFHGYDASTPSLSFSVAKSVLSLLVGCALSDGYFKSIDQPVSDFVPELLDKGFGAVTFRHLLQMTSGIDYAENDFPFGIHVRFYYTNRLEQEILKLRLREPPGNSFRDAQPFYRADCHRQAGACGSCQTLDILPPDGRGVL